MDPYCLIKPTGRLNCFHSGANWDALLHYLKSTLSGLKKTREGKKYLRGYVAEIDLKFRHAVIYCRLQPCCNPASCVPIIPSHRSCSSLLVSLNVRRICANTSCLHCAHAALSLYLDGVARPLARWSPRINIPPPQKPCYVQYSYMNTGVKLTPTRREHFLWHSQVNHAKNFVLFKLRIYCLGRRCFKDKRGRALNQGLWFELPFTTYTIF